MQVSLELFSRGSEPYDAGNDVWVDKPEEGSGGLISLLLPVQAPEGGDQEEERMGSSPVGAQTRG